MRNLSHHTKRRGLNKENSAPLLELQYLYSFSSGFSCVFSFFLRIKALPAKKGNLPPHFQLLSIFSPCLTALATISSTMINKILDLFFLPYLPFDFTLLP